MNIKQLRIIQSNFLHELQDAQNGKKTSLRFIVHQIPPSPIVKNGEAFQAFVIGGTVAKTATLRKKDANIKILDSKQYQISFKTGQDFLAFVEDKLGKDINVIALNFAYPMTPVFENGRLDGILLTIPKEGTFHGLIGKKIAKEIEGYILKKRNKKITASVANDTVCLLLSGLTKYKWHELAGGVIGTGVNFAFFLDKGKLVNLESANFDKFTLSQEASIIDKESREPNIHLFEKETAGAYLYKHFNIIIKDRKISYPLINSTEELNAICSKRISQASEIAQNLLRRSAQLVACQIAGITEFKKRAMVFNMEGSLFWKGNEYKETVEKTVKQLAPKYGITFVEIEESGILGAAKLVS